MDQGFISPKRKLLKEEKVNQIMDQHFSKTGIDYYNVKNSSQFCERLNKLDCKFPSRNKSIQKMEREKKVLKLINERHGKINFEKLLFKGNAKDIFYPKQPKEKSYRHDLNALATEPSKSRKGSVVSKKGSRGRKRLLVGS
jgi:hypothetical protein